MSLLSFILCFSLLGWTQVRGPHSNRLEELLIWKISEELKLSVKEEKSVTTLIEELNQRKFESNEKIDSIIQNLAKIDATSKDSRKLLKDYRSALTEYNKISTEEIDRIQKILPPEKVTKYFVVKSDLSKKIRSLLALPERAHEQGGDRIKISKPLLGDPKIIEE